MTAASEGSPAAPAPASRAAAPPDRPKRPRRWGRRLLFAGLVVAVVGGLEAVPGVPGHAQVALVGQLVVSDGRAGVAKVAPFLAAPPSGACARLESRYEVGNGAFKNNQIGWYASVWPSFQALDALYVTSLLPGGQPCYQDFRRNLTAVDRLYLDHYLSGFPPAYDQGPRAMHFDADLPRVDDSLWMGLTLMRAYDRSPTPSLLARAEDVFALARRNWDPRTGGIYWEVHAPGARIETKAVVSNAPAVILGVQLYRATHHTTYLAWSERIFEWLRANLLDRATGLYEDHVDDATQPATLDKATYTYNQGVMIGATVALWTVDPAAYPLAGAVQLAKRAMAFFGAHHSYGQPGFDVVWAENVLELAGLDGQAGFSARARQSVEQAMQAAPRRGGGLLDASSELTLDQLLRLTPGSYGKLLFAP